MKGDMISGVVVIIIIVMSSILVLNAVNPVIDESRDFQKFNEARETMNKIDTAISDILFEAPGARRSIDINVRDSRLSVVGGEDSIKLRIDSVDIFSSGLRTEEGNVVITAGPSMKAYESDIDGDGNNDLVLENSLMLFAVRKIGSPSSYATVNTTTMITIMKNKRLNINVSNPVSGIFINDLATTAYGVGYSELTRSGEGLDSSSIHVFVNATAANVTYDATFLLSTSLDFVDLQVSHVTGV